MTIKRFLAIIFIVACTGLAWFVLGTSLTIRSANLSAALRTSVDDGLGALDDPAAPGRLLRHAGTGERTAQHPAWPGATSR